MPLLTQVTDESSDAAAELELSPSHNPQGERPALTPEQGLCVDGWAEGRRQALIPDQHHRASAHLLQQSEKTLRCDMTQHPRITRTVNSCQFTSHTRSHHFLALNLLVSPLI